MKINFLPLFFVLLLSHFSCFPQKYPNEFSVMFYNVENLFDTANDPQTEDDEFAQGGERHWTNYRLNQKLLNISKVILNASGWVPPGIVALCEIENRQVLEKLVSYTPLKSVSYKIIHKESPDHRGIDVALLYNADRIFPLEYQFYVLMNDGRELPTREILYFSGILDQKDTLHVFVNHWPSRYGGYLETRDNRNKTAKLLRNEVEKLYQDSAIPKIIILGDFNDQPSDKSILEILAAQPVSDKTTPNQLYNLSFQWLNSGLGTLKYQSQWSVFDQIIVSGALLNRGEGFFADPGSAGIVDMPFLLENDERYGGLKPKRTYNGFSYNGGFSDHLPVLLKLQTLD